MGGQSLYYRLGCVVLSGAFLLVPQRVNGFTSCPLGGICEWGYRGEEATVFAYNADPAQTDTTPLITASGSTVAEGIVANNCLPFGTTVNIEGAMYRVYDRMNSRYGCNVFDIFMWSHQRAVEFGKRNVTVYVSTIPMCYMW